MPTWAVVLVTFFGTIVSMIVAFIIYFADYDPVGELFLLARWKFKKMWNARLVMRNRAGR
jgi:hypothetical protein